MKYRRLKFLINKGKDNKKKETPLWCESLIYDRYLTFYFPNYKYDTT